MENIKSVLWHDNKKYMWDGAVYDDKAEAEAAERTYRNDGFETQVRAAEGKFLLYSRRVAQAAAESG